MSGPPADWTPPVEDEVEGRPRSRAGRKKRARGQWRSRSLHVNVYAPIFYPERVRRQLGFMVRARDPRVPFGWRPPDRPGSSYRSPPRWRWLKVAFDWEKGRGTLVLEGETHLTRGLADRHTIKTFLRLKAGRGKLRV